MADRPSPDVTDKRVALVLGAAVWPGGVPSPTLKRRALHAAGIYRKGSISHIIGCGGTGRHPPSEAAVISALCRDAGVPEACLLQEDRSCNTYENIRNATLLLDHLATRRVVLVTDRFHAPRARMTARHFGLDAVADCPQLRGMRSGRRLRLYLREALALPFYALKLWLFSR